MPDSKFSRTLEPPYYAVIFTSQRTSDAAGYDQMAVAMEELAAEQPGYLGHESARSADGFGITVSYWRDEESVKRWKDVPQHRGAQRQGRERWYSNYDVRVARVGRAYSASDSPGAAATETVPG